MQKGEGSRRLGNQAGRRRRLTGLKWAQAGRSMPAGPAHSGPSRPPPPLDLDASRTIYSPPTDIGGVWVVGTTSTEAFPNKQIASLHNISQSADETSDPCYWKTATPNITIFCQK
jgi:hypothetical protein